MRVPVSWLREYVDLPAEVTGRDVAEKLIRAGLEVETVDQLGTDIAGPIVVGQVLGIEELTGFKKPIRYCQVTTGDEPRGIICGATNFAVGDKVVVSLPGAVLPGGFTISARKTYGHISNGMICSARELGLGEDHSGIMVLPPDVEVGADAIELLGLRDEVLDIAVTPDRGYALSLRGIARETAIAYDTELRDPALLDTPKPDGQGYEVRIEDPAGCDRFVARTVTGIDPNRPSPLWLRRRVQLAGMRPISLVVDVTNYVMLELGQPLHAYDRERLAGPIVVRRAWPGEWLVTLDGNKRDLDPEDLLITDDSGPIGLAGVMGGASAEIGESTRDVVIEAAHFDAITIAKASRRHKLSTEASRRFERGVDPELPAAAAERAAQLLVELGGGRVGSGTDIGVTEVAYERPGVTITIPWRHAGQVAGVAYPRETVVRRLEQIGCAVSGDDQITVTPPSWRPDLRDPNDLAEEVIRLEGYEKLPSVLPFAPPGRGYTHAQRLRRRVGTALAHAGYVEVLCYPFVGEQTWAALGIEENDPRRRTMRVLNPLSDEEPELRTTLLPGLLATARRNIGRGFGDLSLFEIGQVYFARGDRPVAAPRLPVDRGPTPEEIAELEAALPDQPRHVAVVLVGNREPAGWWGPARPVGWADAVEAARVVARAVGVELKVEQAQRAPWHPGRCAALLLDDEVVGYAGELHPRALARLHLPARVCAMELDLDALIRVSDGLVPAPRISTYPVATQDVALIVDKSVPAAEVEAALRDGAGELLEAIRLFDVYEGEQIGEGKKSLAYTLRFRAPDRTLTAEEVTEIRNAAAAEAARRTGATLRGA
ncbi:phenylalanine--tRNA ligase subunit beta [Carbonactinospora thermoautotrophica]|uniref:phenylalanine--tRNA ligase subunit beta n=1 Tax=Carbonactinospora thermoautotrophica TaxID=1469144 RepID=UPI00226FBB28|nr:phenylalanine--tRNA ligase subunit beta [Carbonactinospora thermoautotrophica]MCX9192932.1 phenylalanine--tRNA ligase subunit beta [Carbonactinospora thermoautotrophica]